jgi:integrase/recombinase XerD
VPEALSTDAEEYLSWLAVEKGRSRNTLVAYRRDLATYEAWAAEHGLDVRTATPGDLERHLADLRAQDRNPASLARATTALRGLYRFWVGEGTIAVDPTADVRSPKLPVACPRPWRSPRSSPCSTRSTAELRSTCGTGPCWRSSTAPGPALVR